MLFNWSGLNRRRLTGGAGGCGLLDDDVSRRVSERDSKRREDDSYRDDPPLAPPPGRELDLVCCIRPDASVSITAPARLFKCLKTIIKRCL